MYKKILENEKETNYSVSDTGEVKNDKTNKLLTINNGNVQLYISGKNNRRSVAKLVAIAFIPKENEEQVLVKHLDGNLMNNHVDNLQWITNKENSNNTWEKRRENDTTGAGIIRGKRKRENIVENVKYTLKDNEKQIELDGEFIPYAISTDGKVRNLIRGNYLSGSILHSYRYINFRWNGKNKNKAIHQLVAKAFIDNPNNYTIVDHINGDRLNNNIENLRWVSAKENANNIHLDKSPEKPKFDEVIFTKEELEAEKWKGFNDYKVSNLGRVIGKFGKILNGYKTDSGYIAYTIEKKTVLGHVLVWNLFNGEKDKNKDINHINGNKHDNRLSNLELVTHKENMIKAATETNAWNFRKVGEFDNNGNLLREFVNATAAANEVGILPSSIRNTIRRNGKCYNGLSYKYL